MEQPAKREKAWPAVKKNIEDLPPEILTEIFKFVHAFSMAVLEATLECKACPGSVYRDPKSRPRNLGHSTPRPQVTQREVVAFSSPLHAVSSVCHMWRDITRRVPELWSRLAIFFNSDFPPRLSQVLKQIKLSGHVPLDIVVFHCYHHTGAEEPYLEARIENSWMEALMPLLLPLIPRCRSFIIDMKYNTSLPGIFQFRGHAPYLRVLKLQCGFWDPDYDSYPSSPPAELSAEEVFTFPLLTTLALDGNTFRDAFNAPSWRHQLKTMVIDTLSISDPDKCSSYGYDDDDDDEHPFDLYALASNLSNIAFIRTLTLNNINTPWRTGHHAKGVYQIHMDNLIVSRQLNEEYTEEFNLVTFGSTLCYFHLYNGSLTWASLPPVHHLRLEWIDYMDTFEFRHAMTRFFGNRLDLFECEGLSDELLLHIARHCEPLRRLYIKECPNITVKGLKNMIAGRSCLVVSEEDDKEDGGDEEGYEDITGSDNESILECDAEADELIEHAYSNDKQPPRGLSFRPIHRLVVAGHPEKLSKPDHKWFQDHIKSFHWK